MFTLIKKSFFQVIKIGSTDALSYHQKIRLHTLNGFAVISSVFVILFSVFFSALGSYSSLQALPIVGVMAGVLWLNAKHRYELAKGFMTILLNVVILIMALLDRRTGTEYILLATACSSILLFDKASHITISFLMAISFLVGYFWYDATHPFVPDPTVPYEYMSSVVILVSACAVAAQLFVYRALINRFANDLQTANAKVLAMHEQLKVSYEEQQTLAQQLDWIVKQKSKELQSYLDAINIHVYSTVTDNHGVILKANKPFAGVTGYEEQELIGKDFSMFVDDKPSEQAIQELYKTLAAGQTWRGELRNKRKNGTFFWIDMVVIPLANERGVPNYFLTLALPITERKEAEEQKEKTTQMLEDIAFRASHKVRGPIARIRGLTNLIEAGVINQEELSKVMEYFKSNIEEVDEATNELTRFINVHYENETSRVSESPDISRDGSQ